jgi:hypothetical protein
MPPQPGQRPGKTEYLTLGLVFVAFAVMIFLLFGCQPYAFQVSEYHGATVLTGDRIHVEQACVRLGTPVYAVGENPWGCTNWENGLIVTMDLPKVLRHEQCRWDQGEWAYYTELCPSPVLP